MKPDWFALEQAFIWKVVSMFEWPFGSRQYMTGEPFSLQDAIKCVSSDLDEYVHWRWDGERLRLEGSWCGGSRSKAEFHGPIYRESKERISELEEELTKIYKVWWTPYINHLVERVTAVAGQWAARGIPAERFTLPRVWSYLIRDAIGRAYILGLPVEEKEGNPCMYSSARFGTFQEFSL